MGFGTIMASVMMFLVLTMAVVSMIDTSRNFSEVTGTLLKDKAAQTAEMSKKSMEVQVMNYSMPMTFYINITNTGKVRLNTDLTVYFDNAIVAYKRINRSRFLLDILNPGLWNPQEVVWMRFIKQTSPGEHIIKVVTGWGISDTVRINLTRCTAAEQTAYFPDVAGHYSTIVNGDGTWNTTIQPDSTFGYDNFIYQASGGNDNHGSCTNLQHGVTTNANTIRRTLVEFDMVSILPTDISILESSYIFRTFTVGTIDLTTDIHRVTQAWVEGTGSCTLANSDSSGATWNTYDGVNNWASAGGDFDPTPEDTVVPVDDAFISADVTALSKAWYNGTYQDYGLMVKSANDGSTQTFVQSRSSEYTTASQRPALVVTYDPYCYVVQVLD